MSPDGECRLAYFTGRRCHPGPESNPLKWGADQFFTADLGAKRERELTRCLIRSTTDGAGRGRHPHTVKNTYKTNACYATFPLRWDFFFPQPPPHPVCFGESVSFLSLFRLLTSEDRWSTLHLKTVSNGRKNLDEHSWNASATGLVGGRAAKTSALAQHQRARGRSSKTCLLTETQIKASHVNETWFNLWQHPVVN